MSLSTATPANARDIFEALANHMSIANTGIINTNINLDAIGNEHKPEQPRTLDKTVFKHIPETYCRAHNFTTPKTKNAVTDDSYHCAVKAAKYQPGFERSTDVVSWGKVFAYLMRQPLLARQAGMIYQTSIPIDASYFPNGGWLYVDLAPDSDYRAEQNADDTFIKRYAARIPQLIQGEPRQVFAPILFPVTNSPTGNYDELFTEVAEFDDGFAKIVHCQQPPNRSLLEEQNDGAHPVKDTGIRLGWDDEQILIWYIRQMLGDAGGQLSGRLDAPLGVFGYSIDVRQTAEPENNWESLNQVQSIQPLALSRNPGVPNDMIEIGGFSGELPYQVYPMQLDGRKDESYWLPMYFAYWNGHHMILPDPDAAAIYQTGNANVSSNPERDFLDDDNVTQVTDNKGFPGRTGTGVTGPAQNQLNQIYNPGPVNTQLRYGNNYEFRVRMQDLSGGAPPLSSNPVNETASDITTCRFKRFISPNQPRIHELDPTGDDSNLLVNNDTIQEVSVLNIQRPKLGYPAVVYTGKYDNPIQRLIDQSNLGISADAANANHRVGLGIADPDVDRLEISVEIASLKLDKLESISGNEDYIHLYTTYRSFAPINTDDDYESALNIPIVYKDVRVLHSGNQVDIINDLDLNDDIDNLTELVLPTGRTVRLTIRAVCEEKEDNENYYGFINDGNKKFDNRFGEIFQIMTYRPSGVETNLLVQSAGVPKIQGIFMQSDVVSNFDGKVSTLLFGRLNNDQPNNVQQLADKLNIESNGLTLNAPKGQRIVFGCSSRIRHTLAPDNSSITFASKGDLINHWLCCISLELDRDWMWDALESRSFIVRRTKKFTHDENPESTNVIIGDIEMVRTASFESLHKPQRNSTRLIFIDAVEPKKDQPGNTPVFPDTIDLNYSVEARFKQNHGEETDAPEVLNLSLPITTPPSQVPKIISAGIALSPYKRNEKYSASETRKRQLWIEFEEPILDSKDTFFCRVLSIAPDQLISNNNPALLVAPEEPPLPIDPELIRVIGENATNDLAGLNAMQPMQKSSTSDRHYLLPLPPGLHANADEMFGFFTYELRVGHYEYPVQAEDEGPEKVWSTAQGRFGRRLRATGIQHPAPTLTCMANRDSDKLWVTAPYAVAVHDGKNVTADPPRTELWALLYAQVKQADKMDYRNILLNDRRLDWRVQVETEKDVDVLKKYTADDLQVLNSITINNFNDSINYAKFQNVYKLIDYSDKNKNAKKYGTTVWTNNEIDQLLNLFGLPSDSPLSVLVVEILPTITNIFDHFSNFDRPGISQNVANFLADEQKSHFNRTAKSAVSDLAQRSNQKRPSPVSDELGHHRILRTSPLTEVPEVCCTDCE
ncbi:MAG: hypothetical protein U5K79_03115 [Cyclobacteriaceae bacterium]|nr:hypothetical protein [Cyclobacteriaceae bacterium]